MVVGALWVAAGEVFVALGQSGFTGVTGGVSTQSGAGGRVGSCRRRPAGTSPSGGAPLVPSGRAAPLLLEARCKPGRGLALDGGDGGGRGVALRRPRQRRRRGSGGGGGGAEVSVVGGACWRGRGEAWSACEVLFGIRRLAAAKQGVQKGDLGLEGGLLGSGGKR